MITAGYNKIIDNCGERKEANVNKLKGYILKHDWKNIILKRHHKFIKAYLSNDFELLKTSKETEYSQRDLLSIFLRIESQFELYEKENNKFEDLITNKDDIKKCAPGTKLEGRRFKIKPNLPTINKIVINPNSGNESKDKILIDILSTIKDKTKLKDILDESSYQSVMYLYDGLSIDEIAIKKKKNKQYVLTNLIGAKNPRSKCEMGIKRFIDANKKEL